MRKKIMLLILIISIASCKSTKKTVSVQGNKTSSVEKSKTPTTERNKTVSVEGGKTSKRETSKREKEENNEANSIIETALSYSGTPYKYGGTSKKGMDCSGLIYIAFQKSDIALQRVSYMMATQGDKIKLKDVEKGDLLFFNTRNSRKINHVGLVVDVKGDDIRFIHSTSSRGVLVSSLSEGYWNYAFNHARKVL